MRAIYEAEDFVMNVSPQIQTEKYKRLSNKLASQGNYVQILPGAKITFEVPLRSKGSYYVFIRSLPSVSVRRYAVRLGKTRYSGVAVDKEKGRDWRWAVVGPFHKTHSDYELRCLEIFPLTAYSIFIDAIIISSSMESLPKGEIVEDFTVLQPMEEPGPEILKGLQKLSDVPLTYRSQHFIIQAPQEKIYRAIGWAKYVESDIYPTMLDMMGHKPTIDLHIVEFSYKFGHIGVFTGIGKEIEGRKYNASRIYIHPHRLDIMPPYQNLGGLTWETIHGLLNEAKRQANWKPIWQTELLDVIFEMELAKRLKLEDDLEMLWKQFVTNQPKGSSYVVLAEFWKFYGWKPYQKLLTELHNDVNFRPIFNQDTFVYYMSMYAKKNVSKFFEERGWNISKEVKERIQKDL